MDMSYYRIKLTGKRTNQTYNKLLLILLKIKFPGIVAATKEKLDVKEDRIIRNN